MLLYVEIGADPSRLPSFSSLTAVPLAKLVRLALLARLSRSGDPVSWSGRMARLVRVRGTTGYPDSWPEWLARTAGPAGLNVWPEWNGLLTQLARLARMAGTNDISGWLAEWPSFLALLDCLARSAVPGGLAGWTAGTDGAACCSGFLAPRNRMAGLARWPESMARLARLDRLAGQAGPNGWLG